MKKAIQPGQVDIPRLPRSGMDVKHTVAGIVRALQQLKDRPVFYNGALRGPAPATPAPFTPRIILDGETHEIFSTGGAVIERETQSTVDAPTIVHRIPDFPATTIADGETLYVDFPVGTRGQITETPDFLIAATDTGGNTARYYPPADGETAGTAGRFRYPLADFVVADGVGTLTQRASGSNITHVHDLPTIRETGGSGASVFAGFDPAAGAYLLRHILGLKGIQATKSGDNVEIEPQGSSFNLILIITAISATSDTPPEIQYTDQSGPFLFCFRHGISYVPLDLPAEDRDDDDGVINPAVAGEIYDRYVFRVIAPAGPSFIPADPP